MRGLDTNLLVRYLTGDDPGQFAAASRFLVEHEAQGERLYLNTIALCELVWTLRSSRYRYSRDAIARVLDELLATRFFEIEGRDQVRAALADYRSGEADFADYLMGHGNLAAGCRDTVTFDTKLSGSEVFQVLTRDPTAVD